MSNASGFFTSKLSCVDNFFRTPLCSRLGSGSFWLSCCLPASYPQVVGTPFDYHQPCACLPRNHFCDDVVVFFRCAVSPNGNEVFSSLFSLPHPIFQYLDVIPFVVCPGVWGGAGSGGLLMIRHVTVQWVPVYLAPQQRLDGAKCRIFAGQAAFYKE